MAIRALSLFWREVFSRYDKQDFVSLGCRTYVFPIINMRSPGILDAA
jgi:hypothetical protein